jgi:hypothetical protein
MTTYLFLSQSEENFRRAFRRKDGRYDRLCIYLDSSGEPMSVTEVSPWPKSNTNVPDILCVDKVEKAVCLVAAGSLQPEGHEFCRKKGVADTVDALLGYMRELDRTSEVIRNPFKVKAPLHFKQ